MSKTLILSDHLGRAPYDDLPDIVRLCVRKVGRWRVPPNWTGGDWMREVAAMGLAAGYEAYRQFDPSRGARAATFFQARIMGRILTRYRQEWSFAMRVARWIMEQEQLSVCCNAACARSEYRRHEPKDRLIDAVNQLGATDRWLVVQIFWCDRQQTELARELGVSQPAISKRYRNAIRELRCRLRGS